MKYCSHCGKQVMDEAVICPSCGCTVANTNATRGIAVDDGPDTGYAIIGFLIPIVGLILYLVKKDTYPKKAKSAGKWALIGFIVSIVVCAIIYGVIAAEYWYWY